MDPHFQQFNDLTQNTFNAINGMMQYAMTHAPPQGYDMNNGQHQQPFPAHPTPTGPAHPTQPVAPQPAHPTQPVAPQPTPSQPVAPQPTPSNPSNNPTFVDHCIGPMHVVTLPDLTGPEIRELVGKNKAHVKTAGEFMYMLPEPWFKAWSTAEKNRAELGRIDNSPLVLNQIDIKPGLKELKDYVFVSQDVWNKLKNVYGGGPEIARKVIYTAAPGGFGKMMNLVNPCSPIEMKFIISTNFPNQVPFTVYDFELIDSLIVRISKFFNFPEFKIWHWVGKKGPEVKKGTYVRNYSVINTSVFYIELPLPDGTYPKYS
eukprot:gene2847-3538_t